MMSSPYVGLTPYTEEQADYFFGREKETRLISAKLYGARLTLLYGASGVGKSSVLRAGVARALRQEDNAAVVYFNAWQSEATAGLRTAISSEVARVLTARGESAPQDTSSSLVDHLRLAAERIGPLTLILDQFEEYFLYHSREDGAESFAVEFAKAVNRDDIPVSFLVGIREDAYTKLDRFKGRIPNLFANYAHLDHLSVAAARAAIEKPIEQYNRLQATDGEAISIEPTLVNAVLEQVRAGQVFIGEAGRGIVASKDAEARIEAPYLQLVMTRLWDEEMRAGSRVLRLETLERLQGAKRIVETHLDDVMARLSSDQQETAARMFRFLVTPTGTKVAHTLDDLSSYAEQPAQEVLPVLDAMSDARLLRTVAPPLDQPAAVRYEIFHDVLAPAVLDWRRRYIAKQERERARREALARTRRRVILLGAGLLVLIFSVLIVYALGQRRLGIARELAAGALNNLNADPERSVLLAMQSLDQSYTAEGETALRQALAAPRPQVTLRGHASIVRSVAFSRDQKWIVTASDDHTARLWDAATGRETAVLRGHTGAVNSAVFSPNSQSIVTASDDGTARIWEVGSGREVMMLRGHTRAVRSVDFSPDGTRIVTGGDDNVAILWDAATGLQILTLLGHSGTVLTVSFSNDGKKILTGSGRVSGQPPDASARVWDAENARELLKLDSGRKNSIASAAFSPNGKFIVTADDKDALLWDALTGKEIAVLIWHSKPVRSVGFSPDSDQILTAGDDTTARIWDIGTVTGTGVATPRQAMILAGHTDVIRSAVFAIDGQHVATASGDTTARIWDVDPGESLVLRGHKDWVRYAAFSPDGKHIITTSRNLDKRAIVWDAMTGQMVFSLPHPLRDQQDIWSAMYSPDGTRIVTASSDGFARLWDARGNKLLDIKHAGSVQRASFSPDGSKIVTASTDRQAHLFDAATGQPLLVLTGHTGEVWDASFSPDGKRIVTASRGPDNTARIWDAATGKEVTAPMKHSGDIVRASFSPDGKRIVTAGLDHTARVWEVETSREVLILLGHTDQVLSATYNPDGKRILTASADQSARLWDAETGQPLFVLPGHRHEVWSASFSVDGKQIVTASMDKTARVYVTDVSELLALARSRVTRELTCDERRTFLHLNLDCPAPVAVPTRTSTPTVTPGASPTPRATRTPSE